MYRPFLHIFFTLLFSLPLGEGRGGAFAQQNLVPNPSFEDFTQCPCVDGQVDFAEPWHSSSGEADFFHTCSNAFLCAVGVPRNWQGYQFARTGEGYAGFTCYTDYAANNYEYLSVPLLEPLEAQSNYLLTFYLNQSNYSTFATLPVGAAFTQDETIYPSMGLEDLLVLEPQVQSSVFVTDTLNWTKVEGCFQAKGGEIYLTFGTFVWESELSFERILPDFGLQEHTYHFLDDVALIKIDSCLPEPLELKIPNVFTPNGDGINDYFQIEASDSLYGQLLVFNRWGKKVHSVSGEILSWNGIENGRRLPDGIYYYVITVIGKDRKTIVKKGFVHLLR